LISNAVKYRDAGLKPATGRSGTASLTARALLGKDGMTTLDITTGELDAAAAPGTLKKIQLKQFDPNGLLQTTSNYLRIGAPTKQLLVPARVRGSALEVQANVIGVDPTRTDVVTITEKVKLRPDLTVGSVGAAAQAVVGTPVTISSTVSEQNGDVGARSDCVLSVDGAEVDRANGIWVDAGRSVSCVFMHTFNALGAKQLTVGLANVWPGDYDDANNQASTTIQIVAPPSTNDFNWWGLVTGATDYHYSDQNDGYWYYTNTTDHTEWSNQHTWTRDNVRNTDVNGSAVGSIGAPFSVEFTDRMDGTVLHQMTFDPVFDQPSFFDGDFIYNGQQIHEHGGCAYLAQTEDHTINGVLNRFWVATVSVCTGAYSGTGALPNWDYTQFEATTSAADVSYYSNEYSHTVYDGVESTYAYNADVAYAYGNPAFGSEYSFSLSLVGPNGTKRGSGAIPIVATPVVVNQPYSCGDYTYGTLFEHYCGGYEYSYNSYYGSASGTPDNQ
jgi:hypothetical protein